MKNAHGRTCKKTKVYIYLYIYLYENLFENECIYLSGFVKTWLKKFQVHFNYLTSKWNGKQLKVTS